MLRYLKQRGHRGEGYGDHGDHGDQPLQGDDHQGEGGGEDGHWLEEGDYVAD